MAQHILLSARYRDLTIAKIARMSEQEAYELICRTRFAANGGEPESPCCGVGAWKLGNHAQPESEWRNPETGKVIKGRKDKRQFRCKKCRDKFSATSETLLNARKLSFQTIVMAVKIFSMGAKGVPSTLLGAEAGMTYKSAFVLAHKLREAQIKNQLGRKLQGIVEIDGSYLGGHYHQPNEKSEHVDRRKVTELNDKRMAIVVARERSTPDRVGLSICGIFKHESDGRPMIYDGVDRMATVYADDASHWDAMHAVFNTGRVNHSQRFYDKGVCTNQAESIFSRVDRMERGTHHHMAGPYLWGYACDAIWREEKRRSTQSEKFDGALSGLLLNTTSRTMKRYWQRHIDKAAFDIAVAEGIAAGADVSDEGRMSREDAIEAFGFDPAEGGPTGEPERPGGRKQRKPFAKARKSIWPAPWSELIKPPGLPSLEP